MELKHFTRTGFFALTTVVTARGIDNIFGQGTVSSAVDKTLEFKNSFVSNAKKAYNTTSSWLSSTATIVESGSSEAIKFGSFLKNETAGFLSGLFAAGDNSNADAVTESCDEKCLKICKKDYPDEVSTCLGICPEYMCQDL